MENDAYVGMTTGWQSFPRASRRTRRKMLSTKMLYQLFPAAYKLRTESGVAYDEGMETPLEQASEAPLYVLVKRGLVDLIEAGGMQGGSKVPSEHQLMGHFKVSRITVRRALSDLASEGYLYRLRGKGTFVAHRKVVHNVESIDGIVRDLERQSYKVSVDVLKHGRAVPPVHVAAKLKVPSTSEVYWGRRLLTADSIPLALVTGYFNIPPPLFPKPEESAFMLSTLRDKYGLAIARAERDMQAVVASREEAALLECPEALPMLRSELSVFDREGRCWGCSIALYRGDRYIHHQRLNF